MVPPAVVDDAEDASADGLITALYRAAAGDLPWHEPLAGISALFGAWGVQLLGVRLPDGAIAFSHDVGGPTPEGALDYFCRWHRVDPRTELLKPMPVGQWMSCHDHFDAAFVARDPFYRDYLIPHGGRWISAAKIFQDDGLLVMMGIHRGRDAAPLGRDEVALGRRFGHHISTALGLWRRQQRTLQQAVVGKAVLSRLAQPVFLVDAQLRLHHLNDAARGLLDADARLHVRTGLLGCGSAASQAALSNALRNVDRDGAAAMTRPAPAPTRRDAPGLAPVAAADASPAADGRAVLRAADPAGGASDLLLLLSPLRPAETMGVFGPQGMALLMAHDPSRRAVPDPLLLSMAWGLTPAEAQVAARIAAGDNPKTIARAQAVSVHTVRSQLGSVFAKTGTSRQADLAALLGAMPGAGAVGS